MIIVLDFHFMRLCSLGLWSTAVWDLEHPVAHRLQEYKSGQIKLENQLQFT